MTSSAARSPPPRTPVVPRSRSEPAIGSRPSAAWWASSVVSEQLLEDLVVQRLLGAQPREAGVLLLHRLQPPNLAPLEPAALMFPAAEGLRGDPVASAQRAQLLPSLLLLRDCDELRVREPAPGYCVRLRVPLRRPAPNFRPVGGVG